MTVGFGAEATSLSKVCDTAYGKGTKDDIFSAQDGDNKTRYMNDIWTYCSTSGAVPSALKASLGDDSKTTWSKHLLSSKKLVDVTGNEEFWKRQQEEFGSTTATSDTFFTQRFKAPASKSVKDVCMEAYKLDKDATSGSDSQPTEVDILKYCSLTRG